jgi:hypothetical protein
MESKNQVLLILGAMFIGFIAAAVILLIGTAPSTHPVRMIVAIGLLIGAMAVLGRAVAFIVTKKSGFLFYPNDTSLKPPPAYSQAQARRLKGDFNGAMELYAGIVTDFPQESRAWIAMVEIAIENMKDAAMARDILDRGLAAVTTENGRRALRISFDEKMESLPHRSATDRCD